MNPLEGANCAGLPGFVIEKYFECHSRFEPLQRMAALAICGNCEVVETCRTQALNTPTPPTRGVIAGMPAAHMLTARAWRRYEQGVTDTPPRRPRPSWLPMTDATEATERIRIEDDPDEQA